MGTKLNKHNIIEKRFWATNVLQGRLVQSARQQASFYMIQSKTAF